MNIYEEMNALGCTLDSREKMTYDAFVKAGIKFNEKNLLCGDLETKTHRIEIKWDGDLIRSLNTNKLQSQLESLSLNSDKIAALLIVKSQSYKQNSKIELITFRRAMSECQLRSVYLSSTHASTLFNRILEIHEKYTERIVKSRNMLVCENIVTKKRIETEQERIAISLHSVVDSLSLEFSNFMCKKEDICTFEDIVKKLNISRVLELAREFYGCNKNALAESIMKSIKK